MPRAIVLIQGHPDPSGGRFCHALADAYAEGAQAAGANVHRIEVAQLDFPLLRTQAEYHQGLEGTPPAIQPAQQAINRGDHLVLVYPLWHGTMPALLKGFIEQTMRPGFALDHDERGFPKALLKGKSARIIVTMGMPAFAYRWFFGAHSLKSLERNILRFSGIKPIRESLFGAVESVSDAKRKKWLQKLKATGEKEASSSRS